MSYRHVEVSGEEVSEIVKRLKGLRERDNETQDELAKAIGCTKSAISNIEQGKSAPSLKTVKMIALHYNVSIDFICGLSEDMTIPSNVLDSLCRHISLEMRSFTVSETQTIPIISISKGLFDYLNASVKAEQFKETVPDEFIEAWIEKEKEKAKNSLRTQKNDTVKFALLSKRYITSDKVLSLLKKAFDKSEGNDGPL